MQHVLGLDRQCRRGHRGGDVGVAVAVSADPAAEAQKGRRQRGPAARVARAQGAVQRSVDLGHREEKRLVEHGHDRAHLVERLDLRRTQLPGAPQDVDLLDEPAPRLDTLALRTRGSSSRSSCSPARRIAVTTARRRASVGWAVKTGWTSRSARIWLRRRAPCRDLSCANRGRQRFGQRLRPLVPLTQDARAVVLLGEVGEMEVARERARHRRRPRSATRTRPAFPPCVRTLRHRGRGSPSAAAAPRREAARRRRTRRSTWPRMSPSMRMSRRSSGGISWRAVSLRVKFLAARFRQLRVLERVDQRRQRRFDDVARAAHRRPAPQCRAPTR